MLTRLKVSGFKNLVNVDVRFGPFTCVAGTNAVGKSNLFDAIRFLSALADKPLMDAALSVRDEGGRASDVRSIFHRVGGEYDSEMSFEVEMLVPNEGLDDLGQRAVASTTFLRYAIVLAYQQDVTFHSLGKLELIREELTYIKKGDAPKYLLFPHKPAWRTSAVIGARFSPYFISTEGGGQNRVIKLHHDAGGTRHSTREGKEARRNRSGGRPSSRLAANLPRTVLSATNAAESPTALLARNEMRSWRLLQLEPSSLRQPDDFTSPTTLGTDGAHLAATLYHLASTNGASEEKKRNENGEASKIYGQVASRLSDLIEDVYEVKIDRDERRQSLTLLVTGRDGTSHPARALSDGTLRFLALAVIELDPEAQGLICLEEPENGIHPDRIPAMLSLLKHIASDVNDPVNSDNPLRQVIINTHSPSVVAQVPEDSLLVAELKESVESGARFKHASFSPLPGTWRNKSSEKPSPVSKGKLIAYLNPISPNGSDNDEGTEADASQKVLRVMDRPDLQPLLPFSQTQQGK
ncbi:MAG: AAA family ATPase [Acidobacteria bacterium]|nr:AAA family ATPase [Acidobacteriota bacterium]